MKGGNMKYPSQPLHGLGVAVPQKNRTLTNGLPERLPMASERTASLSSALRVCDLVFSTTAALPIFWPLGGRALQYHRG